MAKATTKTQTHAALPADNARRPEDKPNASPELLSSLNTLSLGEWQMIRDIIGGARSVRSRGETYLPMFPREDKPDYEDRRKNAPFINHFVDALEGITSKPFTKPVELHNEEHPDLKKLVDDADGAGRSLHSFAKDTFEEGVGMGLAGIFVDYPVIPEGSTLAAEREAGGRPSFVDIRAEDVLACYTETRGGKKVVTHLRFRERDVRLNGIREVTVVRVRSYTHPAGGKPQFAIWEREQNGTWQTTAWGELSIDEIPYEPFTTGKIVQGRYVPPLAALAYLQIEHYQQSSSLKNILNLAGFPMLSGNGVNPPQPITLPDGTTQPVGVQVGPGVVLFAPHNPGASSTNSSWQFIEPAGSSIEKLMAHIGDLERQMTKLGRQPLMRQTGNVTATGEAVNAAKAHAVAESWANDLGKALTRCIALAAKWIGVTTKGVVTVHTDFGITEMDGEASVLLDAAKTGKLSKETLWSEYRRRNILGPQFDAKKEADALKGEADQAAAAATEALKVDAEIKSRFAPPPTERDRPPAIQ